MKEIYQAYPDDADVGTLYADALMLQHPWNLLNIDGTPKPWTPLNSRSIGKRCWQKNFQSSPAPIILYTCDGTIAVCL